MADVDSAKHPQHHLDIARDWRRAVGAVLFLVFLCDTANGFFCRNAPTRAKRGNSGRREKKQGGGKGTATRTRRDHAVRAHGDGGDDEDMRPAFLKRQETERAAANVEKIKKGICGLPGGDAMEG